MGNSRKRIFLNGFIVIAIVLSITGYVEIKSSSVVPVLMYHSFNAEEHRPIPYIDPKIFKKQMEFLAKNNYNAINPGKAITYMTKKEKMPPKTVLITADDGYLNFYENAYPVLKEYNLPSTIFIAIDKIEQPGYLGWKELREMSDSGLVTIGSHTKSHPWLPSASVDEEKLHDELAVSKEVLEKGLGKSVDFICYPNG
jgi:peptidoglycan/xylan/chitin deacetylase (PgdA/CDA1 family)